MASKLKKREIEQKLLSAIVKFYKDPKHYNKISIILNKGNFSEEFHVMVDDLVENGIVEPTAYENFNYTSAITINEFDYYLKLLKKEVERERTDNVKKEVAKAKDFNELSTILMAQKEDLIAKNSNINDLKLSSILEVNSDFLNSYKGKETLGSPMGIKPLDDIVEGIFGLVALTAVPGGGKTTMAIQTAYHNAFVLNKPVLYISLEVNKKMFLAKLISFMTQIPVKNILKEYLNNEQSIKYYQALNTILENDTFYVMDKDDSATFLSVYEKITKLKEKYYEDFGEESTVLIVLDYLNLFNDFGTTEKGLDQNQKIAHQMSKFIEIKNNTGDNFLLIAAKNKQGYKTAELSSIKGPNDQEYAFETIISLEKPNDLDEDLMDDVNILATILKSRWGEAFVSVPLHFAGRASRFFSMEELPEEYKNGIQNNSE